MIETYLTNLVMKKGYIIIFMGTADENYYEWRSLQKYQQLKRKLHTFRLEWELLTMSLWYWCHAHTNWTIKHTQLHCFTVRHQSIQLSTFNFVEYNFQSWTKLVKTNTISMRISQFSCMEHRQDCRNAFPPPPLTQCCLEELGFHQGNFGSKATLKRGRGERIVVVSGFQGQSSHSFQSLSTVFSEIVVAQCWTRWPNELKVVVSPEAN